MSISLTPRIPRTSSWHLVPPHKRHGLCLNLARPDPPWSGDENYQVEILYTEVISLIDYWSAGLLFIYSHQRRTSTTTDNSECQVHSIRLSFPLDRIDLMNCNPLMGVLTCISLHISFIRSDVTTEEGGLLGARILRFGVLTSDPLVSQLGRSITAAKHRLNVEMSKSPLFLDLGLCSLSEQEIRSTVTCSDLETRRETKVPTSGKESILWRPLLILFMPKSLIYYDCSMSRLYILCTPVFWIPGSNTSTHRFLGQRPDSMQS